MNTRHLLLLLLLATPAYAEIYKWVDENGKVHFGDRVPEKYKDQAKDAGVEVRQPTEEEIREAEQRNFDLRESRWKMESSRQTQSSPSRSYSRSSSGRSNSSMSDYDRQMAEYRKAQACFAGCARTLPKAPVTRRLPNGTSYQMPGGTYRDMSACGHCKNVKKPKK